MDGLKVIALVLLSAFWLYVAGIVIYVATSPQRNEAEAWLVGPPW